MKNYTSIQIEEFPNAYVYEEDGNYHVNLNNGCGEGVYPTPDWTIDEAVNDQLQLFNNY